MHFMKIHPSYNFWRANLRLCMLLLLFSVAEPAISQKKYQSLFWKVTDPKTGKTSYLYGTMHMSSKMVFHLGEPFYKAMGQVDVVALELEPDAWLEAVFQDPEMKEEMNGGNFLGDPFSPLYMPPPLGEKFTLETSLQDRLKSMLMYDPSLLNYMLTRFSELSNMEDYEEDTWLDMHIYQTGKKLGKRTLGLETYAQSGYYLKLAQQAEVESIERERYNWEEQGEKIKLQEQLEPAYRRQDLDLLDSITRNTSSVGFHKYILVERNKVFVNNIDSVLKLGQTVFAGMGCAHLPGEEGVIEMLRAKGYLVEAFDKGSRDAKQRQKLESQVLKRTYNSYTSADGNLSFMTPAKVYLLGAGKQGLTWLSMDIPNGATFLVYKVRTYADLLGRTQDQVLASIDSVLYESVAGTLESVKPFVFQGNPALDVLNKTRRGEYQRKWIIVLKDELLVLKLNASGDKVKNGYGMEFFNSFKITPLPKEPWTSQDGVVTVGRDWPVSSYTGEAFFGEEGVQEAVWSDATAQRYFLLRRSAIADPGFFDEDRYEQERIIAAFCQQNDFREGTLTTLRSGGRTSLYSECTSAQGRKVYVLGAIDNLNYTVALAATKSEDEAVNFFKSIKYSAPQYHDFRLQKDTLGKFSVMLPFDYTTPSQESGIVGMRRIRIGVEPQKYSTVLREPGNNDKVEVQVTTYSPYKDLSDTTAMREEWRTEWTNRKDFRFRSVLAKKTPTGHLYQAILSDTGCTRHTMMKFQVHHNKLYTLKASYDSILGPGDLLMKAFDSFAPTDTAAFTWSGPTSGQAFLNDLFSTDSLCAQRAKDGIYMVSFTSEDAPAMRDAIAKINTLAKEEERPFYKDYLVSKLWKDHSSSTLEFLKREYTMNMDSAGYQLSVLDAMATRPSTASVLLLKKLLMEEPPIADLSDNANPIRSLRDSLEMAKLLFPEAIQLSALDEYRYDIYSLCAELADSNMVPKSMLAPHLQRFLLEAKTEYKRINTSESDYYTSYAQMLHLLSILYPLKEEKDVAALFQKIHNSRKNDFLMDYYVFLMERGQRVSDSLVLKLDDKDPQNILTYYEYLQDIGKTDWLPEDWNNRELLMQLFVKREFADDVDIDSVALSPDEALTIRGQHFTVYRVKMKEKDTESWRGAVLLLGEEKNNEVLPKKILESGSTFALDGSKSEEELYRKELRKMTERHRFHRNGVNSFESFNLQWDY